MTQWRQMGTIKGSESNICPVFNRKLKIKEGVDPEMIC